MLRQPVAPCPFRSMRASRLWPDGTVKHYFIEKKPNSEVTPVKFKELLAC